MGGVHLNRRGRRGEGRRRAGPRAPVPDPVNGVCVCRVVPSYFARTLASVGRAGCGVVVQVGEVECVVGEIHVGAVVAHDVAGGRGLERERGAVDRRDHVTQAGKVCPASWAIAHSCGRTPVHIVLREREREVGGRRPNRIDEGKVVRVAVRGVLVPQGFPRVVPENREGV